MFYHIRLLNPFTPSSGQNKIQENAKFLFIFLNPPKQTVPCKSTAKEISFEWTHHRILSTTQKLALHHITPIDCRSERVNKIYCIHGICIKSLAYLHTVTSAFNKHRRPTKSVGYFAQRNRLLFP